jgi:hypothetical protein
MSAEAHDPELERLATDLAGLRPAGGGIDRDRLFFAAGQAAAGRRAWLWPGAAAALACLVVALSTAHFVYPPQQAVERIVYVPVPPNSSPGDAVASRQPAPVEADVAAADVPAPRSDPLSCFGLERLVSRWGIDALPVPAPQAAAGSTEPRTSDDDLGVNAAAAFRSLRIRTP